MAEVDGTAVARLAAGVAQAVRDAEEWLRGSQDRLHLDASALGQTFRGFARRANRLRRAAERPTAVAVFGASQAGKSYLVSSLAAPRGKPLIAAYGTERLNFLKELNPEGDRESTGLVSRFTVHNVPAPNGTPVPLRLLSQTDVVKILANTFLEDFQNADIQLPDPQAVAKRLEALAQQAGTTPCDSLTVDDIEEMREYFSHYFHGKDLIRALGSTYWTRAAELIPRLPAHLRAEAYAPLWNGAPQLTRLAADLIGALGRLGFADTAFCTTEALGRRGGNLLDAATVLHLGRGAAGDVQVATASGIRVSLDRALVTALIAEVTIPLAEQPWDFFNHTDLLDFPGARSRKGHENLDQVLGSDIALGELFLRGKVAYLFQRYNAEQEIAVMLFCIGPSVQNVTTLPKMVTNWIEQTMGATPSERQAQRTSLFLVLTKFDTQLDGKMGEDVAKGQRWTNRLISSLVEPFHTYNWLQEWTPGRKFNNVFWLRSTAVPLHSVYDYDGNGTETLAPRAARFFEERLPAYVGNELVQHHFVSPRDAWDAVLQPNDGGVSHLAAALRPVCAPALKTEQVAGRLAELVRTILAQLRPYHHTGDVVAQLERARAEGRRVLQALVACAGAQMFGALLRSLQVTTDQINGVYWELQTNREKPNGTVAVVTDYLQELGDLLGDTADIAATGARDSAEMFTDMAIAEWSRGMATLAEDPTTATALLIPRDQAMAMVQELERAARRLDLRTKIADMLRDRASFQNSGAAAAQKPVMLAEQIINNFVYQLGYDQLPLDKRPQVPNGTRRIFAPRHPVKAFPDLAPNPTPYGRNFEIDWMIAMQSTFEANARHAESGTIDIAANEKLGAIIAALEGVGG